MFDNDKLGGRKIDQSPEFGEDQLNMSLAIIASIPCVSGAVHKAEILTCEKHFIVVVG